MRIVLAGGSGQVGTILARHFHARGDDVVVLSRSPAPSAWRSAVWDARSHGAVLMRTETELVLKSRRVVPGRLLADGFAFAQLGWATAAADLCARVRRR